MKHSRSVMLFATASLAISGLAYCIFNPAWAVLLAMIASLLLGWFSGLKTSKELRVLALMLLAATCLVAMVFFLNNSLFQKGPLYAIAALAPFSFYLASAIRRGDATAKSGYLTMFGLGWVAGFAQSAFNALGVEDFGIIGYLLVYGFSGYLLGKRGHRFFKQLVFISPILLVNFTESALMGTFSLFSSAFLPAIASVSLLLGNLAARPNWLSKLPIAGFGAILVAAAFSIVPESLEKYSWQDNGTSILLPPFQLVGLKGDTLQNEGTTNKVSWIELYNLHCRSCWDEMASLEKVAKTFVGNDSVQFITASSAFFESHEVFKNAEKIHQFQLWHGYEFDSMLAKTFVTSAVPLGLLIDKHGRVRYQKLGFPVKDAPYFESGLTEKINDLLAEK